MVQSFAGLIVRIRLRYVTEIGARTRHLILISVKHIYKDKMQNALFYNSFISLPPLTALPIDPVFSPLIFVDQKIIKIYLLANL